MKRLLRRTVSRLAFLVLSGFCFLQAVTVQAAPSRTSCFRDYYSCLDWASNFPDFWRRTVSGLDCAVDLVACVRSAVS